VRTAFDALLQAIEAKPGDEIVLSAVNIESMAAVAKAHGVTLVPVDIDVRTMAPTAEAIGAAARGFPPGELLVRLRRRSPQRMLKLLYRRLTTPVSDVERVEANRDVLGRLPTPMVAIAADIPDHYYWLTPILLDDPGAASKALVRRGYDATRGATSLRAIETEERKAPHARALMPRVLYLPPPFKLSAQRREALAQAVRELQSEEPK